MHDRANPYMTALVFREVLMAHVLTWGNGYAEIVRNGYGEVKELWPVPPHRVQPKMQDGRLVYRVRMDNGQDLILPADKVLHVHGLGYDGFVGYSPVSIARKSLGLSMAMESFGSRYFGAGTHLGAIVSHPGKLSQQAHDNLQTSLVNAYSGLGNTHKLLLLEEGMSVQKYGIPRDLQREMLSRLNPMTLVIGFARRFAPYKRATLLLADHERLRRLLDDPQQPAIIVFAGKAHPADTQGSDLIREVVT